jgi:hypothetical protein
MAKTLRLLVTVTRIPENEAVAKSAYKEWYDDKWKKEAIHLTHQLGLLTKALKREPTKEAVDALATDIQTVVDSIKILVVNINALEEYKFKQ